MRRARPITLAVTLAAVAVVVLLVSACGRSGTDKAGGDRVRAPRVLTMADGGTDPQELIPFSDEVARLSGGSIHIEIKSGWRGGQRTYETGLIGDVEAGKADLGWAGSRVWDAVGVTSLRALAAPLLIDSYALQEKVLSSPLIEQMLDGLRATGLVALGVLPGQMRRPFGTRTPLVKPADYAGLTIGVQESRVADATMRALGARPVRLPIAQADISRLGGIEQRVSAIEGLHYAQPGRYLTANVDLWPRPIVLFANPAVLRSLTADQRRVLRQAAAHVVHRETALDRVLDREPSQSMCRSGVVTFTHASPDDLLALRRAVQPVYTELERDPATRRFIAAVEQLKRDLGPVAPDALPACPSAAAPAATAATPLDGVYRMTTSFKHGSRGDPTPVQENYGAWTFVFTRGLFAIAQEDREGVEACTWLYGTYAVKGSRVEWSVKDSGGIAPHNTLNKPGEFFVFGWSRFRDTLTLTPVKGAISPLNFRAKPWRRVSATPSRRHFPARCPPPAAALP